MPEPRIGQYYIKKKTGDPQYVNFRNNSLTTSLGTTNTGQEDTRFGFAPIVVVHEAVGQD